MNDHLGYILYPGNAQGLTYTWTLYNYIVAKWERDSALNLSLPAQLTPDSEWTGWFTPDTMSGRVTYGSFLPKLGWLALATRHNN